MTGETNTEKALAVLQHANLQGLSDEPPKPGTELGNGDKPKQADPANGESTSGSRDVPPDTKDSAEVSSPRFALLAKKEKALQKDREEIKALRAELEKERETFNKARESGSASLDELKRTARENPKKALETLGLTYNEITEFFLNDEKPTPELREKRLREELTSDFKKELEAREKEAQKKREDEQKEAEEKALSEFRNKVFEFIDGHKDEYELINLYDAHEVVTSTIEQQFEKTNRIMSTKEAADLVEKYLFDKAKSAKKLNPQDAGEKKNADPKARESAPVKSLSNAMTSSAPSILPPKTEEDRLRRALAKLG